MKLFIIVQNDVTIANGVVFAPGATIVHSLFRRDRDSVTRFPNLADVRQRYAGAKIQIVETSKDATYSYVRKAQLKAIEAADKSRPAKASKKVGKRKVAKKAAKKK